MQRETELRISSPVFPLCSFKLQNMKREESLKLQNNLDQAKVGRL